MEIEPDLDALTTIISALKRMPRDDQQRTMHAVAVYMGLTSDVSQAAKPSGVNSSSDKVGHHQSQFSEDRSISAKDFLRDKRPSSDVDKVACLGYYLTHYRETPHFKTLEISALNTEAAQPKFSNASMAVENAAKAGLLVPAIKGSKQLSAAGENYVQLLPDREAAREMIKASNVRRRTRRITSKKATVPSHGSSDQ